MGANGWSGSGSGVLTLRFLGRSVEWGGQHSQQHTKQTQAVVASAAKNRVSQTRGVCARPRCQEMVDPESIATLTLDIESSFRPASSRPLLPSSPVHPRPFGLCNRSIAGAWRGTCLSIVSLSAFSGFRKSGHLTISVGTRGSPPRRFEVLQPARIPRRQPVKGPRACGFCMDFSVSALMPSHSSPANDSSFLAPKCSSFSSPVVSRDQLPTCGLSAEPS